MYLTGKLYRIYIENPFKTWWKVRKYFKRPKAKFYIGLFQDNFRFNTNKILDINIHDVEWKDKWNSPRHEDNPLIFISLFKYLWIYIEPSIYYYDEFGERKEGDLYYWEYLLDYLYYSKRFSCYSAWESDSQLYRSFRYETKEDGSKERVYYPFKNVVPVVAMSLNEEGIKQLKSERECTVTKK